MDDRSSKTRSRSRRLRSRFGRVSLSLCVGSILVSGAAWPHGVLGNRFFPSTLAIEDPFANDELTLLGGFIEEPGEDGEPSADASSLEFEYAKTILPSLAFSVGDEFTRVDPDGENVKRGTGNLELGVKYQSYTNVTTETVLSPSLGLTIGKTGDTDLEADDFSTLSPALLFGQGFGRIAESVAPLRPFALVGSLSLEIPLAAASHRNGERERHAISAGWGVAILYDLHFLQTSVRNTPALASFDRIVPVVEVAGETCLHRGCSGDTTGFVNPGFIWVGRKFQLATEARIPVNDRTGDNVGVQLQIHFYLDDLLPNSLGRPIFASE